MDAAAQALGLSPSDLRTALQSGQSLASLASAKGVSQDTLTSAITAALQKANPSLSGDQAKAIEARFLTQVPGAYEAPGVPTAVSGAADPDGVRSVNVQA